MSCHIRKESMERKGNTSARLKIEAGGFYRNGCWTLAVSRVLKGFFRLPWHPMNEGASIRVRMKEEGQLSCKEGFGVKELGEIIWKGSFGGGIAELKRPAQ